MDVPVQSILLLNKPYRNQNGRGAVWRSPLVKVALDLNHVRIRGLGMGGKRAGGKGRDYKNLQQTQTEACCVFGEANASLSCCA